jgi:hypothetical protein
MTYSYDPTTDLGRMRRTIPDRVEATALFSDEELQSFLDDEGDWRRATASALETIASDAAMLISMSAGGTSINGSSSANSLLNRAAKLRDQAAAIDEEAGGYFDIAEWAVDDFSARDIVGNALMRGWP